MRKLIFFVHTSLDGFVAGPKGEMNWILLDDQLFDFVKTQFTDNADAALYGRNTFFLMQGYWPDAGKKPGASKHDIEHAEWYNRVKKYVLSESSEGIVGNNVTVISENVKERILELKKQEGKDILVLGSPGAVQSLLNYDVVDEFWLSVNPVILGEGNFLFKNVKKMTFELADCKPMSLGIVLLHYTKKRV